MTRTITYRLGRASGFTLVECLAFVAIWASVGITSLWAVRHASQARGDARHAAELALIAQSELERARALPAAQLTEGAHPRTNDAWPMGTSCTLTVARRPLGAWTLDVAVGREGARSIKPVRLVTVRGATP